MSYSESIQFVSDYLTNFFDDASEDQIKSVIEDTDPAIIQVMHTLIDHDISFQEILEATTKKIEILEIEIDNKEKELRDIVHRPTQKSDKSTKLSRPEKQSEFMILEKLKSLKSATYNAKLFPICIEIFKRYNLMNQPISIKQIHKEFDQERVITSFKRSDSKSSSVTKLLNDIFVFEIINKDLMAIPSVMGMSLYKLSLDYYSSKSIIRRFEDLITKNTLSGSRKKILKLICETQPPFTNNSNDKARIAAFCGIHKDNISKYLVHLVKLGLLNRVPDAHANNLFTYQSSIDSVCEML